MIELARDAVDRVGLGLRSVMFPELDPRMRVPPVCVKEAQRRAVARRREHRARREVDSDPDDLGGFDTRARDQASHGTAEHLEVVVGVLERPVGTEDDVLVGRGQSGIDHPVAVWLDLDPDLATVGDVDEHGAAGLRAEVDADRVAGPVDHGRCGAGDAGFTTTLRPRRDASMANASEASPSGYRWVISAERSTRPASASAIARGRSVCGHATTDLEGQLLAPGSGGREAAAIAVGDAHEGHATAGSDGGDRVGDGVVVSGDLEGDIDRDVTDIPADRGRVIGPGADHEPVRRPECPSRGDPMGQPIGGHDDRCAARPQELDQQQAERPAAVDAGPGADRDRCQIERVERDTEWLEQGDLVVSDGVRHRGGAGGSARA